MLLFKIFLYWSSGGPPVQWSGTIYAIFKEGIMRNIQMKLYEIWTSGVCSVEKYHLCNFGRGYQEEQFCEIILNLDQWFRRKCCLKDTISVALAALGTTYAILKEGIMGNIHVKI